MPTTLEKEVAKEVEGETPYVASLPCNPRIPFPQKKSKAKVEVKILKN